MTVISFCAFWCDTWREQCDRLAATTTALQGLPVDYLTISVDGRWAERGQGRISGIVLLDPGGEISRALDINAVPYVAVVDAQGRVRYAAQGIARAESLQRVVRGLVNGEAGCPPAALHLTFDDFPQGPADEELLDLLRARRVRATFFCLGERVERFPEIARRAAREGHMLQLHSWDHRREDPQLERCARALLDAAGVRATLYRPPGSPEVQRLDGTTLRHPVVNPFDYTRPGQPELARRVLHAVKPGSVILLHAGVSDTRQALPRILDALRGLGFAFEALE